MHKMQPSKAAAVSEQSLGEIGSHFEGIGPSAASQNTRRLEERLE